MKTILLISQPDERLNACFSGIPEYQFRMSASPEIQPDTACVLINAALDDSAIRNAVRLLKRRKIPFAAIAFECSEQKEEMLLDSGVSQIFSLPISPALLRKRIEALTEPDDRRTSDAGRVVFASLVADDQQRGAFVVQEADFAGIYQFVLRLQERLDKPAQLVRFRFRAQLDLPLEPGAPADALPLVQKCLRRGDIVCVYGHQIYAILLGSDPNGAKIAADRIVSTYQAYCRDSFCDMQYEISEITPDGTPEA